MVDPDLVSLARLNPSKFQRLNQRLQPGSTAAQGAGPGMGVGAGGGGAHTVGRAARPAMSDQQYGGGGGARLPGAGPQHQPQHQQPAHGGVWGQHTTGNPQRPAASAGGGGAGGGFAGGGDPAGSSGVGGARDVFGPASRCVEILQQLRRLAFPPAQRPFVFFLEAVDSQRLAHALARRMARQLQVGWRGWVGGGWGRGDGGGWLAGQPGAGEGGRGMTRGLARCGSASDALEHMLMWGS